MRPPAALALAALALAGCNGTLQDGLHVGQARPQEPPTAAGAPAPKKAPAQPLAPLPAQVAGFAFGLGPIDAANVCLRAGGEPILLDKDHKPTTRVDLVATLICTKEAVRTGFDPFMVSMDMCNEQVCEVGLVLTGLKEFPSPQRQAASMKQHVATLTGKYGPASSSEGGTDYMDHAQGCAAGGKGKTRHSWMWGGPDIPPGRLVLSYNCGPNEAGEPINVVTLIYQNDPAIRRRMREYERTEQNY